MLYIVDFNELGFLGFFLLWFVVVLLGWLVLVVVCLFAFVCLWFCLFIFLANKVI